MKTHCPIIPVIFSFTAMIQAEAPATSIWKKQELTRDFLTEGISAGDIDGDGVKDLVAGAFWFKGPDFKAAILYRPGQAVATTVYQEDSFLSWVEDFDKDGKNDILMASRPGKDLTLYLNPGSGGSWTAHQVMTEVANESPIWADLDGDGKKEMVCMQGGAFGYTKIDYKNVTKPWAFIAISEKHANTPYVHGLGVGDINGDGRPDILEKSGWFEQPAEKDGKWLWHPENFAKEGGAQMLVFDADGDGDNDVITSMNAHGYGLAWFENHKVDGAITFIRHEILPEDPTQKSADGLQFSQLHSLAMGDFDQDGRMDFITGKRYFAHGGKDPGANDPALLVIFYNRKGATGLHWQSEVIDTDSGVGCQVLAMDLNGDGTLEIAVGNKKGVHVMAR